MEKKKSFGQRVEAFFAGKGFYIVLFLCVAVIGVSAWVMLPGTGTDVDSEPDYNEAGSHMHVISPDDREGEVRASEEGTGQDQDLSQPPLGDAAGESMGDSLEEPGSDTQAEVAPPQAGDTQVWTQEEPAANPQSTFIWPLVGEVETPHAVSSLIYNRTMGDWRTHDGIDISADLGAQVMAVSAGVVEDVYTDEMYGVTVVIDHHNGVKSIYSNLAETPTVYPGDSVMAGEVIGAVGNTALAEAGEVTHLHFAMKKDEESVDPLDYLPAKE